MTEHRYAVLSGNIAMAMGGAAAGVNSTVRTHESFDRGSALDAAACGARPAIHGAQVEDENWRGSTWPSGRARWFRAMCATSGGGFALMSEGLGMSP